MLYITSYQIGVVLLFLLQRNCIEDDVLRVRQNIFDRACVDRKPTFDNGVDCQFDDFPLEAKLDSSEDLVIFPKNFIVV